MLGKMPNYLSYSLIFFYFIGLSFNSFGILSDQGIKSSKESLSLSSKFDIESNKYCKYLSIFNPLVLAVSIIL